MGAGSDGGRGRMKTGKAGRGASEAGRGPAIEGYEWRSLLGSGGSADVHRYRQLVPEREVAIKVLRERTGAQGEAALRREANVLARVSSHPGIVSLYATGATPDGLPWLALEACSPERWRRGMAPLPVPEVLRSGVVLAGALATMHALGVVHRDVKPSNILVTAYDAPVLTDFGISGTAGLPMRHGEGGLSVPWAAPEVHATEVVVLPSQDVYSLAATMWTWLAGVSPFEVVGGDNSRAALTARILTEPVPGIGRRDVPVGLERLLATAMSKQAQERPTAEELGRALQAVQREAGLPETSLEVRAPVDASRERALAARADDPDATRLRPVAMVSPSAQPRSFEFSRQGEVGASLPTASGQSGQGQLPAAQVAAAPPARFRLVGIAVAVLAAVLVAGVVLLAVLRGGGWTIAPRPEASGGPASPIASALPGVSGLQLSAAGGEIVASWQPPEALPGITGASYGYRIERAGHDPVVDASGQPTVSFPAVPGSNCIEVWVRGDGGRVSAPERACLTL